MDAAMMKWALAELEKAYPDPDDMTRKAVTAMLNVWSRMTLFGDTAGGTKLNSEAALDVFARLARGQKLVTEPETEPTVRRVWASASQYGQSSDHVRVIENYDPTPDGWKLNGREGVTVDIRRGDLIMEFTEQIPGAPSGHRGPLRDFEVDISHLMREESE